MWSHHNPPKPWSPLLHFWYCWKALDEGGVNVCDFAIFLIKWINQGKVIELIRVDFFYKFLKKKIMSYHTCCIGYHGIFLLKKTMCGISQKWNACKCEHLVQVFLKWSFGFLCWVSVPPNTLWILLEVFTWGLMSLAPTAQAPPPLIT